MRYADILVKVPNQFSIDPLNGFMTGFNFVLNAFGHQYNNPAACCNERIIGDFELIYFLGGDGVITIKNKDYKCGAGDIIFIPPFTKHKIQTSSNNPHNNYWIHFDILPYYKHNDFISAIGINQSYKFHAGMVQELISLYSMLENEINNKLPGYKSFLNTTLLQILTLVFRFNKNFEIQKYNTSKKRTPEESIVDKSFDLLYNNLSENTKISDICRYLHISESYLYKCFSKVLRIPPNRFIQLVKIKRAEQLIKTTSLSFKEISDMLGFSSPYYFSNIFKKYYNVSPREYASYECCMEVVSQ